MPTGRLRAISGPSTEDTGMAAWSPTAAIEMEWLVRQPQRPPAVTALTLGVVGKKAFPELQGRNQAFRHLSVLFAAGLISLGTDWLALGQTLAFWILAVMAAGAILTRGSMGAVDARHTLD